MPIIERNRVGVVALGGLSLLAVFGYMGSLAAERTRAAETLTTGVTATVTPVSNPPLNVREANTDADGYIKVRQQGTLAIMGTVDVSNAPAVQDVRVTNSPLQVTGNVNVKTGTLRKLDEEFYPFNEKQDIEVDISEFSRVRLWVVVNGSDSTVDFVYTTDAGVRGSFSVDTGDSRGILLNEVAGTKLRIFVDDPDGEQVFVSVFGTY